MNYTDLICIIHNQLAPHLTLRDLYYLCLACSAVNRAYRDHIRKIVILGKLSEANKYIYTSDGVLSGGELEYLISGNWYSNIIEIDHSKTRIALKNCSAFMLSGRITFVEGVPITNKLCACEYHDENTKCDVHLVVAKPKRPYKDMQPKLVSHFKPQIMYCRTGFECDLSRISSIIMPFLSYKMIRALVLVNRDCRKAYSYYLGIGFALHICAINQYGRHRVMATRHGGVYIFGSYLDKLVNMEIRSLILDKTVSLYSAKRGLKFSAYRLDKKISSLGYSDTMQSISCKDGEALLPDCECYIIGGRLRFIKVSGVAIDRKWELPEHLF